MDYVEARMNAGMSDVDVMQYLNISKSTIRAWKIKNRKTPKAVIELLRMIAGYCPTFSKRNDFSGWRFNNGFLHSPAEDKFTSGDVLGITYNRQLIKDLDNEVKILKKKIDRLKPCIVYQFPTSKSNKLKITQ